MLKRISDRSYIEKIKQYDRKRKQEQRNKCTMRSPENSSPLKGPSYYSVLKKSKFVRNILGHSPKSHATVLKHVLKHAMNSPRKAKYLNVNNNAATPKIYAKETSTPVKQDTSVTKELRKIAILRSHHKHEESRKRREQLRSKFRLIKDIAKYSNDDPTHVYRLMSDPKRRLKEVYTRKLDNEVKAEVLAIFNRDEISYCLPDMKYAGFRFMSCTINEAYVFYLRVAKGRKVAEKTFGKLKPRCIKTMQETPMRGSRCEDCQNFGKIRQTLIGLGLKGIPRNHSCAIEKSMCKFRTEETDEMDIRNPKMRDEYPARKCAERKCDNCGVTKKFKENLIAQNVEILRKLRHVTWTQWDKVIYVNSSGEEKSKLGYVQREGSCSRLLEEYFKQLTAISMHQFLKVWQKHNFDEALRHLQPGQVILVQDFQMNMLLYIQDEPAQIHWDHAQGTVHPTTIFYRCVNPECKCIVREDLIHLSPDKDHDRYAVKQFFERSVEHLKKKNIPLREFIIFTDNCVGQYKSKFVFYWMSTLSEPCTHHFYASKHGKGPSDRAGGVFKKKMRSYVKAKGVLLTTEDIEKYCAKKYNHQMKCGDETSDETSDEKIDRVDPDKGPHGLIKVFNHQTIRRPQSKNEHLRGIVGTRDNLCAIRNTGVEGILQHRFFDCCCFGCVTHSSDCSQPDYAEEWKVSSVLFSHKRKFTKAFRISPEWFKPVCDSSHQKENDATMHLCQESDLEDSDEEEHDDFERDEGYLVDVEDPVVVTDDLSGIEQLPNETEKDDADVQILGINEYESSEEELDGISPLNESQTEAIHVTDDESMLFNWKSIIEKFKTFTTYQQLKAYIFENKENIPKPSLKLKYFMKPGDEICEIANKFRPRGMPDEMLPISTIGDGNCLPHALAHVLLSDQLRSDEVRVRIAFTAVIHEDSFVTHETLSRGGPYGTEKRHHSYALYSGSLLAATTELNEETIRDIYHRDVLTNSKDGNFMGIWQFHHAAEAYKRPICSIYPQHTNRTVRSDLNRVIFPLDAVHDNKMPVSVMWSPLHRYDEHANVKHFVAVLKVNQKFVMKIKSRVMNSVM